MNFFFNRAGILLFAFFFLITNTVIPSQSVYAGNRYLPQEQKEEMKPADQTEEEEPEEDENYNLEEISRANKDAAVYVQLHEEYAHKATLTFFIGSLAFMGASYFALRNRNTGVLLGACAFYAGTLTLFSYYLGQSRGNLKKASEIYRFDLRSKEQGMTLNEVPESGISIGLKAHPETRAVSAGLSFLF